MVYEYGYEKERITEVIQRQNLRFSTLLLPLFSMAAAPPVSYTLCKYKILVASSLWVERSVQYVHCSVNDICLWPTPTASYTTWRGKTHTKLDLACHWQQRIDVYTRQKACTCAFWNQEISVSPAAEYWPVHVDLPVRCHLILVPRR